MPSSSAPTRLIETLRIHQEPGRASSSSARACALGNQTLEALIGAVVEGRDRGRRGGGGGETLISGGGVLYDAACSSGPWAHSYTHARLPSADATRRFVTGDLFHVDCYGSYGGYFFDFARSRVVGDDPTPQQRDLLEAVIEGVEAVCAAIRPA